MSEATFLGCTTPDQDARLLESIRKMREAKGIKVATDALPCPFCGQTPTIQPWHGGGPRKRMIACDNEDCDVSPQVAGSTPAAALRKWNTRA